MEKLKTIKKYNIFKNLDDQDILAMLRCFNARITTYKKDKHVITSGERINFLYLILSGSVRETLVDTKGNINTYIDYKEGDIIGLGYAANAYKTFYSDMIALEDTTILLVDSFRFLNPCQNYCPRHTKVINNSFAALAKQNIKLINRIKELTMSSTKEKVMCYLSNMRASVKSSKFDIPYNRQELANYLGVERTALSKELSALQKDGIIKFQKNHFEIIK